MGKNEFTYKLILDGEVEALKSKIKTVKDSLSGLASSDFSKSFDGIFKKLEKSFDSIRDRAGQGIISESTFKGIISDSSTLGSRLTDLLDILQKLQTAGGDDKISILPEGTQKRIIDIQKAMDDFSSSMEKAAKKSDTLIEKTKAKEKAEKDYNKHLAEERRLQDSLASSKGAETAIKEQLKDLRTKLSALGKEEEIQEKLAAAQAEYNKLIAAGKSEQESKQSSGLALAEADLAKYEKTIQAIKEQEIALKGAEEASRSFTKSLEREKAETVAARNALEAATKAKDDATKSDKAARLKAESEAWKKLKEQAIAFGISAEDIPRKSKAGIEELKNKLIELKNQGYASADAEIQKYIDTLRELEQANNSVEASTERQLEAERNRKETYQAQTEFFNRAKSFVGLTGGVQAFSRAVRDAVQVVGELDKEITEMAVVTSLDVGDYWDQLPEYTERANQLGVSIRDTYKSATLFYQQGLKTNEVIAMSNETLKMARIANLDAKDATDKMTAALRGFNMELNETSAQRIADVYSELAAITASDVKEISSAMTKTASIAASAGMEFETTAAFLSQIIETTRESAETAGTALKTVIARFQELKKDPSEIGEVDGEIVDANKIETALRSVGVALRDSSGQFRELDDVFLELSSKWDGLDTNTQRYIATIAAGSRQQSRFIAMMSDYGRTQELVSAANTSACASNKQFEKTLDSLDAKLNQLKNAWNSFAMGIADDKLVKTGVDLLTNIITLLNKATSSFDGFGSAIGKIGILIMSFRIGKILLEKFIISIKEAFKNAGQEAGDSFEEGIKQGKPDIDEKEQNPQKKKAGLFQAAKSGFSALEESKAKKEEAGALQEQATQLQQSSASKQSSGQDKVQSGLGKIEAEFKEKMSIITGSTKKADFVWNKYADDIKKGGKQAKAAIDALNKELSDTADAQDLIDAQDSEDGFVIPTADEFKSMEDWRTGLREITDGNSDMSAAAEEAAQANDLLTQSEEANNESKLKLKEGLNSLGTAISKSGEALVGAGVGVTMFGSLLESIGVDGAADKFAKFGSILTTVGSVMMTLPTILTGLKAALKATGIAGLLSGLKAQLGWWPVVLIVLAVVAVIAILIAAFVSLSKNTPEAKLKKTQAAAEAAADAANQAKEAYDGLADSFDNLADKYNALEDLTAGTREWRDAVKEINGEVMGLVDQYLELASLVTNENGVLKIDLNSVEAQAVLDKYEDQANRTNSAELAAKISVGRAEQDVAKSKLGSGTNLYGAEYAVNQELSAKRMELQRANANSRGQADQARLNKEIAELEKQREAARQTDEETRDNFAKALAEGLVQQRADGSWGVVAGSEEQLKALGLSTEKANEFAKELGKGCEELRDYGEQIRQRETQEKAMYDAMAANALSMANTANMSETAQKQIANVANADYMEGFADKAMEQVDLEENFDNKYDWYAWVQEEAASLYGVDKVETDKNGNITYKNAEGNEQKVSYEEFRKQLAAAKGTENAAKAMESIPKAINNATAKLGPEVGKAFKNMFSDKDGRGMTAEDIESMKGQNLDESLDKLWEALGDEGRAAFASREAFVEQQQEIIKAAELSLTQATELSTKSGIDVMSGIGVEAARGYAEKMRSVFLASGEETAKDMDEMVHGLTDELNQVDKTKFFSALNAVDWSDIDSLESLPDTLKELNVNIDPTALNEYITALGQANGAIRNIDVNKLKESAQTLTKLSKDIASGEQGRSFSKENYEALIEMDPDLAKDFVLGLDGEYQYLGTAMSELTDAIRDNTTAMLQETMEILDNKIATAEIMDQMKVTFAGQELSFSEVAGKEFDNELVQKEMLKRLQQNAIKSGVNITGISGFNETMNVDNLSSEELRSVLDQLMAQQSAKDENEKLRQEAAVDTGTTIYQKNTAAQNAYGIWKAAGKNYEGMTQEQKNEFTMRSDALGSQAIVAGVDEKTIANYTTILELYKKGKASLEDMNKAASDLANATSYKQMREGLQSLFEEISSISEEYDKIAEGDVQGKLALANKALADFGIEVDNAVDADMYMELLNQLSQGSETALATLANAAKGQGEVTDAFFDQMAAVQLGYWKDLGDGTREFVWATAAELESIANAAGTAVEMWENPYTWLYNQNEQLNRLTREREKYEREYTRALEDESKTAEDLLAISQQQLANLKEQAQVQAISAARALDDIQAQFDANAEFSKYVRYDATSGTISVDYAGLDAAGIDSDKGSEFEEFLSSIEENRDVILDAEEALRDIEDQVEEVKNRGKEETSDLYNRIKEGLVQSRQNEIDKLSDINESIQDAQASLVDQMQKQIDEARQARDNEKTEQDITDKEARLAYLMRNTSGGNATEIASLQKEIADAKEGYADSLVDQSLAELQDANAKAAEQRQHQIDIAQAQLDAYTNSAEIWTQVQSILETSQAENKPFLKTQAGQLIALAEDMDAMNPIDKDTWISDLDKSSKLSEFYTSGQAAAEAAALEGELSLLKTNIGTLATNMGTLGSTTIPNGVNSLTANGGTNLKSIVDAINNKNITVTVNTGNEETEEPPTIPGSGQGGGEGGEGLDDDDDGKPNTDDLTDEDKELFATRMAMDAEIEKGKQAILSSFSGGGAAGRNNNAAYTAARDAYVGMGGTEEFFDNSVFGEINPLNTSNNITTGTFPGAKVDWKRGFFGNVYGMDITLPNGEKTYIDTPTKSVNPVISEEINKLYAAEGMSPDTNWMVLYNNNPYMYYNGGWKEIPEKDGDGNNRREELRTKMLNSLNRYKTGGLADFTGPAWLDGTKSKPEIVLNQQDSANFLVLRDILSDILNGTSGLSRTDKKDEGGDNYYDIEINVESLGDDYDVEQLADKVRGMIYDDATYRNVNAINK